MKLKPNGSYPKKKKKKKTREKEQPRSDRGERERERERLEPSRHGVEFFIGLLSRCPCPTCPHGPTTVTTSHPWYFFFYLPNASIVISNFQVPSVFQLEFIGLI